MRLRRVITAGAAALATAVVLAGLGAPAHAERLSVKPVTLANTITLSNCSASLVRYPTSTSRDRAMMLTNGHCYEGGFLSPGVVLQNEPSSRTGSLLDASGATLGTVLADRVLYATMTGTDVTLYRLTSTFAKLKKQYGATPLTISASAPAPGATITIPSGYWKQLWNCKVDDIVGEVREEGWVWQDSIRYDVNCDTIHGTSGSPLVDATTGRVVGINNTGNDNGQMCTLNNPCEVNPDGTTSAYLGQTYGVQTYWLTTCLTSRRKINLALPGCLLTQPAS